MGSGRTGGPIPSPPPKGLESKLSRPTPAEKKAFIDGQIGPKLIPKNVLDRMSEGDLAKVRASITRSDMDGNPRALTRSNVLEMEETIRRTPEILRRWKERMYAKDHPGEPNPYEFRLIPDWFYRDIETQYN